MNSPDYTTRLNLFKKGRWLRGGACIDSKIAKIYGVHAGVPIEIIKDFLVHRNISTTMIYAKVKTDTLKKAGLAFDQSRVSTRRKSR